MVAILWLAALVHVSVTAAALPGRANRFDFSIYYASALALREGLDPYRIELARVGAPLGLEIAPIDHATDPPAFLLCFAPLTMLRPRPAYWLWIGINLAALLGALWLLLGASAALVPRQRWALAALALLYPPVGDHFFWAQNKILVLLMLALMMRWVRQGRDAPAGLMLALAGLWRGFPLILAGYLALGRRWRALRFTAAGVAAGAIATVAVAGTAVSLSFLTAGVREVTRQRFLAEPINVALPAFVSQLFWYAAIALGIKAGARFEVLRLAAVMSAELGLLAITVRATARCAAEADPDSSALALWVVASVLLAPTAWVHYLVLMLLPFAVLAAAERGRAGPRACWLAAASFLTIAVSMNVRSWYGPDSTSPIFIAAAEGGFVSLTLAYLSAYRFVTSVAGR